MTPDRYNVRVYGVYIENQQLLVCDEIYKDIKMTKLPGGGIEFGEGLVYGLEREWKEELDIAIEVGELLYVNPFFQCSVLRKKDQMICIYYAVKPMEEIKIRFSDQRFDFVDDAHGEIVLRWLDIRDLSEDAFTFPIDKSLIPVLQKLYL